MPPVLTVVTPTIPERAELLGECKASVRGFAHLVGLDVERVGPAAVRNSLVEKVATPWVLFLDDDDVLHDNYFDTMVPELTDDRDVVYSWCETVNVNHNLDVEFDPNSLRRANFIPVTACVRVEKFREVGGFPDSALEDWGLWVKILDAGGRFHLVKEKLWTYRRSNDGRNLS